MDFSVLAKKFTIDQEKLLGLKKFLLESYAEPARKYHNLNHIKSMLKIMSSNLSLIEDPDSFFLAVWFHDAVYRPESSDNESASSDLAAKLLLDIDFPKDFVSKICSLIIATDGHLPRTGNFDELLFLDTDLAVLGSPRPVYLTYSRNIYIEYKFVPAPDYIRARKMVLNNFLKRDCLYFTDRFQDKYEKRARENLAWEIHILENDFRRIHRSGQI